MRQSVLVAFALAVTLTGAPPLGAQMLAERPSAPDASDDGPIGAADGTAARSKAFGLDLFGPVSATWGPSGVRMQAERVANSRAQASPTLYLRLWASEQRPVFGDTVFAWVLGSYTLGSLAAGTDRRDIDTGFVPFEEPPAGCYYVTMALQTFDGTNFEYWSFITFNAGGTPDGQGYVRFEFGGTSCGATPATAGVMYGVENDSSSTLFRIDDFAGSPRVTLLGSTGLSVPAIAIDPTTGTLYAVDQASASLYRLDASTGQATRIGGSGLVASDLVALAARSDGTLFAWDADDTHLYRLDKATGRATLVGSTGFLAGGDLAFARDGTLYGSTGSELVRIDSFTGQAARVGSFGIGNVFGLAFAGTTLYAGRDAGFGSGRLYRVDVSTGFASAVGSTLDRNIGDLALLGSAASAPDADFIWSPFQPVTGQQVQFTDVSAFEPTSWTWNLDGVGGPDSTQRHPTWTYHDAGTYQVSLQACNAAGCTTAVQPLSVVPRPTIVISGPASGKIFDPLPYEATATGCVPNPFSWTWTTDADFDYAPRFGAFNVSGSRVVRGWATTGPHVLLATNGACPGAQGVMTVQLTVPSNQTTWLNTRLASSPKQRPTVVFCHGVQAAGFDATCRTPSNQLSCGANLWSCLERCDNGKVAFPVGTLLANDADVNKLQFVWSGAGQGATGAVFAENYVRAWNYADDAARQLAQKLRDLLGADYRQPIQFVGHSLGSVVCGQAAVRFLNMAPGVPQAQLSTLDRPDHVHKLVNDGKFQEFETRFGFDADYFPSLLEGALRPNLDLRLDNYWSRTGAGVGDSTSCVEASETYNHPALSDPGRIGDRYFVGESDNDHTGVHQWYRWSQDAPVDNTIATSDGAVCTANGFVPPSCSLRPPCLGASLSPCSGGWNVALPALNGAADAFTNNCTPLRIDAEAVHGCVSAPGSTPCQAFTVDFTAERTGAGDQVVEKASVTVEVPVYARHLLFDLEASKTAPSVWAVVTLDQTPIWSGSLAGFAANTPVSIGPVSLYGLTGRRQLSLQLTGSGNVTVRLRNLRAYKVRPPCATGDSLCVTAQRFRVTAEWTTSTGLSGHASPRYVGTDASGFLWFFDPANLEVLVKVLDGCGVNSRFWVFAGGLTNVAVRLTVTDTATGAVKVYDNPQGVAFPPIQDTDAFATCGLGAAAGSVDGVAAATSQVAAPPAPLGTSAALRGGRFDVTARWRAANGTQGSGQFVGLTDDAGYLWFFGPHNIEVAVKVLDACGLNGRYWVFAAGLTDVEVDLTITDRRTGATAVYHNALGQRFSPVQDTNAFATCP